MSIINVYIINVYIINVYIINVYIINDPLTMKLSVWKINYTWNKVFDKLNQNKWMCQSELLQLGKKLFK